MVNTPPSSSSDPDGVDHTPERRSHDVFGDQESPTPPSTRERNDDDQEESASAFPAHRILEQPQDEQLHKGPPSSSSSSEGGQPSEGELLRDPRLLMRYGSSPPSGTACVAMSTSSAAAPLTKQQQHPDLHAVQLENAKKQKALKERAHADGEGVSVVKQELRTQEMLSNIIHSIQGLEKRMIQSENKLSSRLKASDDRQKQDIGLIHEQMGLQEPDAMGTNPDPVRCLPEEPAAYVVDPQLCAPSWEEPARVVGVEESKSSSHDVYHTDHVIENVGKPAALANSARRRVSPRVASSTAASSTAETVSAPRLLHCGGKPSSRLPRVFHGLCVSSGRQAQRHLASAKTRSDHRHGQYRSSMRKCPTISKEDIANAQVVASWIQVARDWGIANQYPVAELIQVIRNAFGDQCEALLRPVC